jgi:hypothetical protein
LWWKKHETTDFATPGHALLRSAQLLWARTRHSSPQPASSSSTPATAGSDAQAILDQALPDAETHGGGSGKLLPQFSNTLAGTPAGVIAISFAFTCTGGADASITVLVDGKPTGSASSAKCDGSVLQKSADVPRPSPVGFEATIKGSTQGSFAYEYLTEKKG